jgi:hypothetical protein
MYPFIHSRGGVGNTLLDKRHGNLYGGVGSSFLAAVINVQDNRGGVPHHPRLFSS